MNLHIGGACIFKTGLSCLVLLGFQLVSARLSPVTRSTLVTWLCRLGPYSRREGGPGPPGAAPGCTGTTFRRIEMGFKEVKGV